MLYNAVNGQVEIDNTVMEYIRFGKGDKNLIMIPGVGDGLRTVKGLALPFALMYRKLAKDYTVWVFSRKKDLEDDATTYSMAVDQKKAMDTLGIEKAHIVGVSQGGMIAQHMAINYPETIDKLVLVVTMSKQNDTVQQVINTWREMAEKGDWKALTIDNFEKSYSENYLKKYRAFYSLIVPFMKPEDSRRFIIQAKSCISHHTFDKLKNIKRPTLIISGMQDKIVTPQASEEMAKEIKNSRLLVYKKYGHALYEEAGDFLNVILDFLK